RDYRVWNDLGIATADRAEQERGPRRAAERERWLRRAIMAFEHVLVIEPEDLTAHFKLSELYGTLAGMGAVAPAPSEGAAAASGVAPVTAAGLRQQAKELANPARPSAARLALADELVRNIPVFLRDERDPFESRLSVLVDLLDQGNRAFRQS